MEKSLYLAGEMNFPIIFAKLRANSGSKGIEIEIVLFESALLDRTLFTHLHLETREESRLRDEITREMSPPINVT